MSKIEALEELLKFGEKLDDEAARKSEHGFSPIGIKIQNISDEIEREVAERYMERPCDKNGEPTCVGQRIRHRGHEGEVWLLGVHEVMCSDRMCYPCGEYEHVKPRTLEDVLIASGVSCACVEDVAAEIRELLGASE